MRGPVKLSVGSRVRWHPDPPSPEKNPKWQPPVWRVAAMSGPTVRLLDGPHAAVVDLGDLVGSPTFEVVGADHDLPAADRPDAMALVDVVGEEEAARAEWLAGHIMEMETGFKAGVPTEDQPDPTPGYDPAETMADREAKKLAELADAGHEMSAPTLRRLRGRWHREGLWGLCDRRQARVRDPLSRADPRLVAAIRDQMDAETNQSTGNKNRLYRRVKQTLEANAAADGSEPVRMPPTATFNRYVNALEEGTHLFGLATTRHKMANSPKDRPWTPKRALRPGEMVEFDTSSLDVMVLDWRGEPVPAEITIALDIATRSICAWHIGTASTRAVDAAQLLAHMIVPEPMRPDWEKSLEWSYRMVPGDRMMSLDERLQGAARRPVIYPECVNVDRGRVYLSRAFQGALTRLGISMQPARPYRATDKGSVERTFDSIRTLFSQHCAGYTGGMVAHRGSKEHVEDAASLTIDQVRELFAEFIVAVWGDRPHKGLRFPEMPGVDLTPNQAWEIGIASAGYVHTPADPYYFYELLPVERRKITRSGVTIERLTYNGPGLAGLRMESGDGDGKWAFHVDANDRSRIYFKRPDPAHPRDRTKGEWVSIEWVHARDYAPFSDVLWDYVRRTADQARKDRKLKGLTSEAELRDRLFDLQRRAETGDLTRREAKVAANDAERTGLDTLARPGLTDPEKKRLRLVGGTDVHDDEDDLNADEVGGSYEEDYDTIGDDDVEEAGTYDAGDNW